MERKYNIVEGIVVMLIIAVVVLFGCAKANDANENGGKSQNSNSSTSSNTEPNRDSNTDDVLLGKKISQSIKDINGVEKSTVFIKETTALVGVTLKDGSQEISSELRSQIEEKVTQESKDIKKVAITADKEIYEKLDAMANDFMNGKTLEELKKDLTEIIDKIKG